MVAVKKNPETLLLPKAGEMSLELSFGIQL